VAELVRKRKTSSPDFFMSFPAPMFMEMKRNMSVNNIGEAVSAIL
jgi:hypothetical protein